LLEPHLERLDLPLRTQLEVSNNRIDHAYILEDGIASVVANGGDDTSSVVGLIGSEGMTDLSAAPLSTSNIFATPSPRPFASLL
jgi:hypothetical protein